MKAAYSETYGPPEVLDIREIPVPKPGPEQLLIKVKHSTVNRTDCGIRQARPFVIRFFTGLRKPRNPVSGCDFSGEVIEVGEEVSDFQVGERIFGFNDNGMSSHAEYMVIDVTEPVDRIPEGVDYLTAAASCEGAHYAYNYVRKILERKAEKVFVNGGTGAIGSAGIQMLKYHGLTVMATAPTGYVDKVRSLGADHVIDYMKEDFTAMDEKFDVIFDSVGKSTFRKCKRILRSNGVYMSSELGPGAENLYLPLLTRLTSGPKVLFPVPVDIPGSLRYISNLLRKGKFKPLVDREYPLEQIVEAFRYADSGEKIGNVILRM